MTNEAHSGSRWELEHRRDGTAELPVAIGSTAHPTGTEPGAVPAPPARKRRRPLAALTAAGLVLVGGAGGWAIGSAAASTDTPAVEQPGTDGTTGTQEDVPVPPGGEAPDRDGDRVPHFGGRGGIPDFDDDGSVPPDG